VSESSELSTSLIITSYHTDEEMFKLTENCLASLEHDRRPDEVIVVDDASPYKKVVEGGYDTLIIRTYNGGFPECSNTGFEAATKDILILSNNDLVYSEGWLDAILEPIRQGFDIAHVNMSDSQDTIEQHGVTEDDFFGSLWAMRREVYTTLGGFDIRFKGGTFEDKDYYMRAKQAGFTIGKNNAFTIEHVGRATMDKLYPNQEDFEANMKRFEEKWGFIL